jgi:hypothetical protein
MPKVTEKCLGSEKSNAYGRGALGVYANSGRVIRRGLPGARGFRRARRRAIEFCDANITAADMPTVMNMQGTIDFIAAVEGVSRKAAINSPPSFDDGGKAVSGPLLGSRLEGKCKAART